MKRIISLFLCSLMLTVLCSCDNDNSVTETKIETSQTEIIDYKTIAPPKDGWTLKLLKDVVYVNGITKYEYYNCDNYSIGFLISHDENKVSTIRLKK